MVLAVVIPDSAWLPATSTAALGTEIESFCNVGFANSAQALPQFRVLFATPLESNIIRVFLTRQPKHLSPLAANDVLNRLNWLISVLAGAGVTAPVIETIGNAQAAPQPGEPFVWSVDIGVDRRLELLGTYLIIASATIVTFDEALSMAPAPYDRDDFPGDAKPRSRKSPRPTRVNSGIDLRYDTFSAIFVLDPKQDIDVQAGIEYLKKRIIRRLITSPGGFSHLPEYGAGIKLKFPFNATTRGQLQLRIEDQLRQEVDVQDVGVSVAVPAPDLIRVSVRVQPVNGVAFGLVFDVPEVGQVSLS